MAISARGYQSHRRGSSCSPKGGGRELFVTLTTSEAWYIYRRNQRASTRQQDSFPEPRFKGSTSVYEDWAATKFQWHPESSAIYTSRPNSSTTSSSYYEADG